MLAGHYGLEHVKCLQREDYHNRSNMTEEKSPRPFE